MKRDRTRCVHSSPDCRLWSVLSENVNYKGKRAELAKLRAAELNMISNIILWVTRSKMALIFETPWANHLVRKRLITLLIKRTDTTLLSVDSCSVGSLAKKSFAFIFVGFSERSLGQLRGLTCVHEAGLKVQSIGPNAAKSAVYTPVLATKLAEAIAHHAASASTMTSVHAVHMSAVPQAIAGTIGFAEIDSVSSAIILNTKCVRTLAIDPGRQQRTRSFQVTSDGVMPLGSAAFVVTDEDTAKERSPSFTRVVCLTTPATST